MSIIATEEERSMQDGACPRCGADSAWEFSDAEQTLIEIVCPDCGRYEVPKAEFDQAQADIAEPEGEALG